MSIKHYFYLVLNTCTYESYYSHGSFLNVDEIKEGLGQDERLIKAWEVKREVEI